MAKYYEKLGDCTPDNLILGNDVPLLTQTATIAAGEGALVRGSVLAAGTDGKLKLLSSTSSSATEVPFGILCDDVDATSEAVAEVYVSGQFNADALVTKSEYALTAADITALRNGGIYLENTTSHKED